MGPIIVHPDRHYQFDARSPSFCLVTDASRVPGVVLAPSDAYRRCVVAGLEPGEPLESLLRDGRCPAESDVFVICPDSFIVSPPDEAVGPARRLAIMPCGSTPVTDRHVSYFLDVVERSNPARLERLADGLVESFEGSAEIILADAGHGAVAAFDPSGDYDWNLQAGVISPGEQQIAPAGELSAIPADIFEFDPGRRLGLNGTLALHGAPIVHDGSEGATETQAELFAALDVLRAAALLIDVTGGVITDCRPAGPEAKPAAEVLAALLETDERYRIVWELGIGLNDQFRPQPGNCGLNEVYGGGDGIVHLGLGLTPATRHALTFSCQTTEVLDPEGRHLCGEQPTRRLNRRRSASCGCQ